MAKKRIPKEVIKTVLDYSKRLRTQNKIPIDRVIIFGSQATGKARHWSDIDVCLISPKFKDYFKALEFLWQERKDEEVRTGLEPVGFSKELFQEGSSLIQEIKKTGVEVK